jgi:HK97 gp10 family phage protein
MSDGIEIRIDGAADVIRRLNTYSLQLSDRVVFLALRSGANFMKKQIQNAAPVRKGRLKRSIRVSRSKINTRARRGAVGVYIKPFAGKKRDDPRGAYYARFVEDGYETKGVSNGRRANRIGVSGLRSGRKTQPSGNLVAGQKFIKNTFNVNKESMLEIITTSIETGGNVLANRLGL